uniref:Uncharacterized protein n=1 Tax=Vespula pensylvanica TaxID=30213 RepID=A0A834JLP5_VESPE|nr:hypothetical protein H0235_017604 [Vespula pensylvanica]
MPDHQSNKDTRTFSSVVLYLNGIFSDNLMNFYVDFMKSTKVFLFLSELFSNLSRDMKAKLAREARNYPVTPLAVAHRLSVLKSSGIGRLQHDVTIEVFELNKQRNRKKKFIFALITNLLEFDIVLFYYAAFKWWYGARESSLQRINKEAFSVRGHNRLCWERNDKENLRAINSDSEKEVLRINIEEEEEDEDEDEGITGDEVVEGECKY